MKRLIWGFIVAALWLGCKSKSPNDIIDKEKMQDILFDIHVVDGYISTIYVQDSARKTGSAYYKGIYKKFDIDSAEYSRSLSYYYQKPDQLLEMYKVISKRLEDQKAKMLKADSLIQKRKFKADSLKIAKKFNADSLAIRKKMKPDSLSKAKAEAQIIKKRAQADSLRNTKRVAGVELKPMPL